MAVVTGAGQGLGAAVAKALAGEGAAVAALGRTQEKVDVLAAELAAAARTALAIGCDVADRAAVVAAVQAITEQFGRIDVVVNAAQGGAMTGGSRTAEASDDEILECFSTGALGTLHVMQACFDALRASGNGVIINFGSGVGVRGAPKMAAYAMAKEAIGALSKVAAQEWGPLGIRVNVVCPAGFSPSAENFREQYHPGQWNALLASVPLRRMGDPDADIGRGVAALATDDFRYLTGATLMLDGGQVIMR